MPGYCEYRCTKLYHACVSERRCRDTATCWRAWLPATTAQCSFSPQPGNWAHRGTQGAVRGGQGSEGVLWYCDQWGGTAVLWPVRSWGHAAQPLEARLPSSDPLPAPHIMNHDTVIHWHPPACSNTAIYNYTTHIVTSHWWIVYIIRRHLHCIVSTVSIKVLCII